MFKEPASDSQHLKILNSRRFLLIVMLTMMSMVGLVGSDVYLPALPEIGLELGATVEAIQYTLSLYLVGLAAGQLILGPLSDRFGRKSIIIIGMLIYFLASISCAISNSYFQLMISRFIQALGASSGLVIGRAIIADIFEKEEAGKILATIFPFVGMSPAVSPVIGGLISYYFGWPSCFLFVAIFAAVVLILASLYLSETLSPGKRRPLILRDGVLIYWGLLSDKNFITYALAPCLAYLAYFAYIAQSPFIFHEKGFGEREIGLLYMSLSLTYVAGNLLARRSLHSLSLDRVLYFGYSIFIFGGGLLLTMSLAGAHIALIIAAMSILTFGNGVLIPMGFAGALNAASNRAGYASGLLGFLQLSCAAFSSSVVARLTNNSVVYLGLGIFVITAIGFCSFVYFLRSLSLSAQINPGDQECI